MATVYNGTAQVNIDDKGNVSIITADDKVFTGTVRPAPQQ